METQQRIIDANSVFAPFYLDSKALYMYHFSSVPCISFVDDIDGEKAFAALQQQYAGMITSIHSYRSFRKRKKETAFNDTLVVLNNRCVLEFDTGYCEILHHFDAAPFVHELVVFLRGFKERQRRKPLEVNLIVKSHGCMELRAMEIKRTTLDLDLFYEDDFMEVDETIRKRLCKKNDKGIVLLHGLPGTGKTTYLRYLVGKIKKKVMFLSPNVAASLMDPDFVDLLIDNPNSVVIIEDAENIIMDRRSNSYSSVSNLLNISDGLLADFLNVQLVCTFNSPVAMVDQALLRKGRLIAKYDFGKLSIQKAQRLSDYLGFDKVIEQPMTIAELANQNEASYMPASTEVLGFRRAFLEN